MMSLEVVDHMNHIVTLMLPRLRHNVHECRNKTEDLECTFSNLSISWSVSANW